MANMAAKQAIRQRAIRKTLRLPSVTAIPANLSGTPISINVSNVGLVRGFWIKTLATVVNADGANTATLGPWGAQNIYSVIQFVDFSQNFRIQTLSQHIHALESYRRRAPLGAAYPIDQPQAGGIGQNWNPIGMSGGTTSTTIGPGGSGHLTSYIYVPLMYSDSPYDPDFRGGMFASLTNVTATLNLTPNPIVSVPAGTDNWNSLFGGVATANCTITTMTVSIWQDVYDQLPDYRFLPNGVTVAMWQAASGGDRTGLMLPNQDLGFEYELKYAQYGSSIVANQPNNIPFVNQRKFYSTMWMYQQGGVRTLGTDITKIRLVAANTYEWWDRDPMTIAVLNRQLLHDDLPAGYYWFDFRSAPILTNVSGNLNLELTPNAAVNPLLMMFTEDIAPISSVAGGSALASGTGI
jgi:hypothetical protein